MSVWSKRSLPQQSFSFLHLSYLATMLNGSDKLAELLEVSLPVALRHVPHRLRDVADSLEMRVALVGGVPRDLMRIALGHLHRDQFIAGLRDFDIVVEGPVNQHGGAGIAFAYELRRRLPGELIINEAFHTATLQVVSDGVSLDITTARREDYPASGELPVVDVGGVSLEEDLVRRDFSVNALALELTPDHGRLIDPTGGVGDIRDRLTRVLHGQSFSDDPTRLLRALRYSMRLEYDIERVTLAMYQTAVDEGVLDHLTPERVRYELECIAQEERWQEIWAVMDLSYLAGGLHRALGGISRDWDLTDGTALDTALRNRPQLLEEGKLTPWLARTAWVLQAVAPDHLEDCARRLGFFGRDTETIVASRNLLAADLPRLRSEERPSVITRILERHARPAVILALLIYQPEDQADVCARKAMLRFVEEFSQVTSPLSGHDLMGLGLRAGPALGQLSDQLRYLRLDGVITDRQGAEAKARELIAKLEAAGESEE